ncbi:MAG: hypothetical protein A2X08_08855 [Bacteroidetes bacterium GWA2_32_17]|nr:MAG: hypothetical protein A2X08_08850 [Bacteroidetes bacterium GWA2_32_17]OFX38110.1 MAG: hypothetical protein A2X08_08855 [Bacteroidetes bacterium GWA2_32_17]
MDISEILNLVSKTLSIIVILLGIGAFAFKKYISEFIKTKFSIQFEKENTKYKQQFLKELEAYKSALVRELENHKLEIDIKRSQVLIYVQKKIEAYELLTAFYSPILEKIYTYSILDEKYKKDYHEFMKEIFKELEKCKEVSNKYSLYLSTTKIKIHLAPVHTAIISLFNENKTIDTASIDKIIHTFSMIETQMEIDLLGEKFYEEAEKDKKNLAWKIFKNQ